MAKNKRMLHRIIYSVAVIIGAACVVLAGLGMWDYLRSQGDDKADMPTREILTRTEAEPSEKHPGAVKDEYTVPVSQPRAIAIPKLGIDAYVQPVGVDEKNQMVAPNNIHFTAWYTGSVAPGEAGLSIINGHAGGRYEQGVFRFITKLTKNDVFKVQMGDKSWREFSVTATGSYSTSQATKELFRDDPAIEQELHLITCDGKFDDAAQTYEKRFIVVARAL